MQKQSQRNMHIWKYSPSTPNGFDSGSCNCFPQPHTLPALSSGNRSETHTGNPRRKSPVPADSFPSM